MGVISNPPQKAATSLQHIAIQGRPAVEEPPPVSIWQALGLLLRSGLELASAFSRQSDSAELGGSIPGPKPRHGFLAQGASFIKLMPGHGRLAFEGSRPIGCGVKQASHTTNRLPVTHIGSIRSHEGDPDGSMSTYLYIRLLAYLDAGMLLPNDLHRDSALLSGLAFSHLSQQFLAWSVWSSRPGAWRMQSFSESLRGDGDSAI
ncbi:uncharacterized protein PG986_013189 [Apiospora aurea]|uniref:Uncharacterized protein n=1 Tax=Apiospora aurea TaxID=335848 RepID=A0ABR1PUW2_9PEZI